MKELMNLTEFCETFSLSRNKAYQEAQNGKLVFSKVGKRTMVRRTDAEAWLAALPQADLASQ